MDRSNYRIKGRESVGSIKGNIKKKMWRRRRSRGLLGGKKTANGKTERWMVMHLHTRNTAFCVGILVHTGWPQEKGKNTPGNGKKGGGSGGEKGDVNLRITGRTGARLLTVGWKR